MFVLFACCGNDLRATAAALRQLLRVAEARLRRHEQRSNASDSRML